MIIPYGKYLLVQLIEPEKKKGALLMLSEDLDPIAKCEILDQGCDTTLSLSSKNPILYFRRYELSICVDKEKKLYLIDEKCLLGYEQ